MNKLLTTIFYYFLIGIGLISVSWQIWSRFIRQRVIRDIPDSLLTEYRFWILLSICITYLFIVKNLVRPKESNLFLKQLNSFIDKPLTTLDHLLKYNKYIKFYYYKFMFYFAKGYNDYFDYRYIFILIYFFQIFPRLILVLFLLSDIFWFHKLEIFYKVVLIGLFPLMYRYIKYSIKDIYEHWILTLEEKYQSVFIYEKGYKFDKSRIGNTSAVFHHEEKTIREYIEINRDNFLCNLSDSEDFEYDAFPYLHEVAFKEYNFEKYNTTKYKITMEDFAILEALYYEIFPNIMRLRGYIDNIEVIEEYKTIKWSKITIFFLYFICWGSVLFISYKEYPIDLYGAKYLLFDFMSYLCDENNPFVDADCGSKNENLVTQKNIKALIKIITTVK